MKLELIKVNEELVLSNQIKSHSEQQLAKLNEEYSLLTDQYNELKESYNCLTSDQFKKTTLESIENLKKGNKIFAGK